MMQNYSNSAYKGAQQAWGHCSPGLLTIPIT
jgi:hypothetical protein